MSLSINAIKSQLQGGGARPTLFRVFITNPIEGSGDFKTPFLCKGTQLPQSTIGVIEVPYMGRKVPVAGDRPLFPEWTVTILNDEDFLIRNAMEAWSNAINGHVNNVRNSGASSNPASYKSDATIEQLGKQGQVLRRYTMKGLFPTDVAQIELSWENNDTIEEYDITFNYDWWEVDGGITGFAGGFSLGNIF